MTRRFKKRFAMRNARPRSTQAFGKRISRKAELSLKTKAPFGGIPTRDDAGNPGPGDAPARNQETENDA